MSADIVIAGFRIPGGSLPVIETERLVLRAPQTDDADAIAECLSDYALAHMLTRVPSPYFRQDAADWLDGFTDGIGGDGFAFAVTLDGVTIGVVGFDIKSEVLSLGYWLGRAYWRRGLMSEAVGAALCWYFRLAPETTLHSGAFTDNPASLALQRKLGFVETGLSNVFCMARNRSQAHVETKIDAARFRRSSAIGAAAAERGNSLTSPAGVCIDAALEKGRRRALLEPAQTGCSP